MKRITLAVVISFMAVIAGVPSTDAARRRAIGSRPVAQGVGPCVVDICNTTQPHTCVQIENTETAWRTCISNQGRRGLVLGPTDLRRTRTG
jgi:hypothetical protein